MVSSINISASIIDDNITEGNQSFFGRLSNPAGPVTLDPAVATVIIFDDAQERKYLCRDNKVALVSPCRITLQ